MSVDSNKMDNTTNSKENRKRKPPDITNPTTKLSKPNPVPLSNRFEPLSDEYCGSEDDQEETIQEALAFINHIKTISTKLTMRYSKETVTFYPTVQTDHDSMTKYLDASSINYHTYTLQHQKDKKFVIRGLPPVKKSHSAITAKAMAMVLQTAIIHLGVLNAQEITKPTNVVNCGEEHPANYSKCEIYQKHLQKIERRRQPTKKPPPPPPPDFTEANYPPLKARTAT
ncbi:hypothetical protein KQX54_009991 [Cotesia glomerata]|uniref:Uncharacterized protein n=1 Tax=Cotesia glomerata TaxID=32391 RepID=A0AAV7I6V1_COTGL|nr:hypothetical protein KQX54_009991 [Cotesia glomerata]